MSRIQFSIRGFLFAVAYVSLVVAALFFGSTPWANAVFSLTIACLAIGTLGAIFGNGTHKTFWGGFAIVGWIYSLFVFSPVLDREIAPMIVTTHSVRPLYDWLEAVNIARMEPPEGFALEGSDGNYFFVGPNAQRIRVVGASSNNIHRVVHCAWTFVFALMGGYCARSFAKLPER